MTTAVPLLHKRRSWVCPNGCNATSVTLRADVHQQMHVCSRLHGMYAPLIEEGTKAKVIAVERDDYIAGEVVTTNDEGRAIMAVSTIRDDGEDRLVFAPQARADGDYR